MKRFWVILWGVCLACGLTACKQETVEEKAVEQGVKPAAETLAEPAPVYPPAPELPPALETLHIAVISDINESYGTVGYSPTVRAAVEDIIRRKVDFVVSPGDLVAGQKQGLDYDAMWKGFHYQVGDVFFDNDIEFIMAPGNHDASAYPQYFAERQAMTRAFENRKPKSPLLEGSHYPFYYAVKIRDVLVVALDITRPLSDDDPQLEWLEEILAHHASPRANLILGHLPIFPIDFGSFWEVANSRRFLDILRAAPSPTLYLSGHHHIFYPAHVDELRLIACPALGADPRSMNGGKRLGGYVMIEIPPQAPPKVSALIAPDFTRSIDIQSLPVRRIMLEREDIGMAEYIMEMLDDSIVEGK